MSEIDLQAARPAPAAPWWRFGMVWFALAGPVIVVIAGIATMAIAFAHPDPAIAEAPPPSLAAGRAVSTAPALQARNHAATPERADTP